MSTFQKARLSLRCPGSLIGHQETSKCQEIETDAVDHTAMKTSLGPGLSHSPPTPAPFPTPCQNGGARFNVILALGRLRQKDHRFEANLD